MKDLDNATLDQLLSEKDRLARKMDYINFLIKKKRGKQISLNVVGYGYQFDGYENMSIDTLFKTHTYRTGQEVEWCACNGQTITSDMTIGDVAKIGNEVIIESIINLS